MRGRTTKKWKCDSIRPLVKMNQQSGASDQGQAHQHRFGYATRAELLQEQESNHQPDLGDQVALLRAGAQSDYGQEGNLNPRNHDQQPVTGGPAGLVQSGALGQPVQERQDSGLDRVERPVTRDK